MPQQDTINACNRNYSNIEWYANQSVISNKIENLDNMIMLTSDNYFLSHCN